MNIERVLVNIREDSASSFSTTKYWKAEFKQDRTSTLDVDRTGRANDMRS